MQLAALLLLAMFVGLIVLAPFSLQVFLKHHFPLLIAPVLVAKACVVLLATAALTRAIGARRWKGAVIAGTLALAVVADHVKLQYDNFLASVPLDLGWMPEVRSRSQHTFAVSWIPSTVAFFVDRWAVGIRPGMEQSLAERARERRFRINKEDLYLAGPNAKRADDRQDWPPDFWLYFPIDWLVPADRASADCRQDYVGKLISAAVRPLSGRAPIVLPNPARSESQSSESGKVVHLIYRADIPDPVSWRVQVVAANRREAAVRTDSQAIEPHPRRTSDELWIGYNCLTQNLHVVTSAGSPGASTLRLEYTGTKPLPAVDVELPLDLAFAGDTFFPILGAGQPSALDLARRASELRVAAMGVGYVLFDLRPLKQKAAAEPQNRKR